MDRGPWWATQSMGSERVGHNLATKQQHVHEVRAGVRTESHMTLVKVHFQSFQSVVCKMKVIAPTPTPTTIEMFGKIK